VASTNLIFSATLEGILYEGDTILHGPFKGTDNAVLVNVFQPGGQLNRIGGRIDAEVALIELKFSLAETGIK